MKVLHVIPSVAPRYGGPSVVIQAMAGALAAAGASVTVATTDADGPGALDVPLDRAVMQDGAEYRYFARSMPGEWKYSRGLARWLAANAAAYDVVHVHALFSYSTIPGCRAAWRAGVPYVLRPLGTLGGWSLAHRSWKKRPYMALVERTHLRRASAIHVTSDAEARDVAALGYASRVALVPLGVAVAPPVPRTATPGAPLRVLFMSRLHAVKNVPLLLDAIAIAAAAGVPVALEVAGDGDAAYVAELRRLCTAAGLDGRVRFLGELSGEAKARALRDADAFVLPSSHENFGIAVAEALAAGLPVIVSDQVGIAQDVARAGAGLVTPVSAPAVADALRALHARADARLAMGEAGRRLAVERYSWAEAARRLIALYDSVRSPERLPNSAHPRRRSAAGETTHAHTP